MADFAKLQAGLNLGKSIAQLCEELRQAEFQASLAAALVIAAENDKRIADSKLAAARHELQVAEEMKRDSAALLNETLGADDCAELLHCSPEQVEELARAGEIPGLKLGRGWLFVRSDLLAYLAETAREEAQQRRAKRQPVARAP